MKITRKLLPLSFLLAASTANAALILNLNGGGGAPTSTPPLSSPAGKTQAGYFDIDLGTSATSITRTAGPGTTLGAPSASGSIAGLSGTLRVEFEARGTLAQNFNSSTFTGGTSYLTTGIPGITTGSGTWAVGSDINENVNNFPGQGIVFKLDLSNVVGDTSGLVLTAVQLFNDSGNARLSHKANGAGASTAVYSGAGPNGNNVTYTVDQALADGDELGFWSVGGGQRRLYGFTFDVVAIPEPSTALLGALGALALLRRRRA